MFQKVHIKFGIKKKVWQEILFYLKVSSLQFRYNIPFFIYSDLIERKGFVMEIQTLTLLQNI